jgi:hypothetical protein
MLLVAFFMNLFGFLDRDKIGYILLNVVGAGISCYASYLIDYIPFVILEGAWGIIALIGLIKQLLLRPANT